MFPAGAAWLFAFKTCVAAFFALYIALLTPLDRPGWAVTTVFIASQAQAGATVSKSIYRLLGTLLGAASTVVLVPNLVNAPELLSVALSAWVAGCLYLSLQDRTPKSYIFMLAGYSAAFIGFPGVEAPQAIFQTALSRVEEITLGVACSTIVHSVIVPVAATAAFEARVQQWVAGARAWLTTRTQHLSSEGPAASSDVAAFTGHLAAMQSLAHHAAYDTPGTRQHAATVARINDLAAMGSPIMAALDRRLAAARSAGYEPPEVVTKAFATVAGLPETIGGAGAWDARVTPLRATLRHLRQGDMTPANLHWVSTITLLLDMVLLLRRMETLRRHMNEPRASSYRRRLRVRRHVEHRLAVLSSLTTFVAMLLGCAFWIASGWPSGSSVPMIAAVGCSFFATLDDPLPPMKKFGKYVVVSVLITLIYTTVILPRVQAFEMVVLVLFPAFMVLGLFMATPSTAFIGMVLATNVATLLGLNNRFVSDFVGTVNGGIATVAGIALTMSVMSVIRTRTPAWSARHLLKAGLLDLHESLLAMRTRRHRRLHREAFIVRMIDRLHAVLPRVRPGTLADVALEADLSIELRLGVNAMDLQIALARHTSTSQWSGIARVIESMAVYVKARSRRLSALPDEALRARIDGALADVAGAEGAPWDIAIPLYNLRLALFGTCQGNDTPLSPVVHCEP